jgi:hypothetical protein
MNGRKAKQLRKEARELTTVHGAKMEDMVLPDGSRTVRVRSGGNGAKVTTVTKCHPEGSYRRVLKSLKKAA